MFGICSCKLPVTLVQIFPGGSEMRRCSVMPHHGHFDGESSQVLVYLFSISCCAISLHTLSTSTFGNPQKYTPVFCTFTTVTASKKKKRFGQRVVIPVSSMEMGCIHCELWLSIISQ